MHMLTWMTPDEQGTHGVIQCSNGHVHLRGVRNRKGAEDLLREIADLAPSLPCTTDFVCTLLAKAGLEGVHHNPNIPGFGEVPTSWREKLYAPDVDPFEGLTLEDLKGLAISLDLEIAEGIEFDALKALISGFEPIVKTEPEKPKGRTKKDAPTTEPPAKGTKKAVTKAAKK